jgi:hypothetical protein
MAVGTFRISIAHAVIFITLVILFGLLAAHFFGHFPVKVAGIEGLICGSAAVYTSAAVILNEMYGRWLLPIGFFRK